MPTLQSTENGDERTCQKMSFVAENTGEMSEKKGVTKLSFLIQNGKFRLFWMLFF